MAGLNFFNGMIEEKLLNLHIAYIAKVLSCDGKKATVQPLTMIKQYDGKEQKPSVVSDIPVVESVKYKMQASTVEYVKDVSVRTEKKGEYVTDVFLDVTKATIDVIVPTDLAVGDLVFCVCADRNITEAKNGTMATPPIGHHNLSDSVIVGIL